MPNRRRRPRQFILRFVLGVVSRPRLTLAVTLLFAAASVVLAAARLKLSTNQNELFSGNVPFFRDFLRYEKLFPENESVYVLVRASGDEAAIPVRRWTAAADSVAARLREIPRFVQNVDARVPLDKLGAQGLLFEDPANLAPTINETREFVGLVKLFAEPPGVRGALLGATPIERLLGGLSLGGLLGQAPAQRMAPFITAVATSWTATITAPGNATTVIPPDLAALDAADPSRSGFYYVADELDKARHVLLVRAVPRTDYGSLTAISETVEAIRGAVRTAGKDFPEFAFGVTGRPALEADEMGTTDRDSRRAEIVALAAVFVGVVVLLRSVWLAAVAELSLGVGIAWTFAWATLTLGQLNLLSIVFLLALIGIGMDYLIQILSRYRAEAGRRSSARRVWVAVFKQVGPPINTACLGAAGAFLVSLFTDFAGAADLGLIAGGGLLLCLFAGYTFMPALLTMWPVRKQGKTRTEDGEGRVTGGSSVSRWIGPVIWIVVLMAAVPFALRTRFNPSLLDLQADQLESVRLVRRLQTWSAVVLSKDLGALRAARDAVATAPTVARTESVLSAFDNFETLKRNPLPAIAWSPPAAAVQEGLPKIAGRAKALAAALAATTPATADTRAAAEALAAFADALDRADSATATSRLSAWQSAFIEQLRQTLAPFNPAPPDLSAVPPEIRDHLIGNDGTYALYIYPKADLWNQADLDRFILDIEPRMSALSTRVTLTGIAHNIHHSTASIRGSFYRATLMALGLIVLLVWLDLRTVRHTLAAVSVLGLGLPMLVGLMGLFHVDWNFANFFALPILIGAGHEYGVFLVHRYREARDDPRRRAWAGWDVADRALLLCAFVTSSSFGFFYLLANHKGLRSLGLIMALGSACIYLAGVAVVRPILRARLNRGL